MTSLPSIQGWCPSSWQPMHAADGWIVRVRPPMARLTLVQAQQLAQCALAFGDPMLELSRRGNWQLRGVQEKHLPALLHTLVKANLASANAQTDALPAVLCTPWYKQNDVTHQLAQRLEAAIATTPTLGALPSKFGFAVDDPECSLHYTPADIRLWHDGQRYWLHPDGLRLGTAPACLTATSPDTIVQQALALAAWFINITPSHAATHTPQTSIQRARRMRHAATQLLHAPLWQGQWQSPCFAGTAMPPHTTEQEMRARPGFIANWGQLVAAPLGRVSARALAQLAQWLQQHRPDTMLHTTPWRMLLITSLQPFHLAQWRCSGLHQSDDWITQAQDPRLRVFACSGQPHCPQALAPTQPLALKLADNVPPGWQLHVSGCAKACAQPTNAQRTLTLTAVTPPSTESNAQASAWFSIQRPATAPIHWPTVHAQALCEQPDLLFDSPP
ncbi:hypothetical protein [Lampropedia puyangensis]|nr:hypothetical protein [Lampropedia puyangensis]